jgi:RNA 2',3'-cyclic 3'-phosphodiesterase
MPDKNRIFVGVPLGDVARQALRSFQQTLALEKRTASSSLRLVAAEQLHLTIKFVGWAAEDRVAAFRELVLAEGPRTPVVMTRFARISAFPAPRRARVLVAELCDPDARLAELAERVEAAAEGLGVSRERRSFRPHVTLARANPAANLAKYQDLPPPRGDVELCELVLFHSLLLPSGSVYTSLCRGSFTAIKNSRFP